MAYLSDSDDNLIEDLLKRKEFYAENRWHLKHKKPFKSIIPRFVMEDAIRKSENLELTSYQIFNQNLINPNTPYQRHAITWDTGLGKTAGVISISLSFINQYKMEREIGMQDIGSVFIIGFSSRIIKADLMKYPEFGFISLEEKIKLQRLKQIASTGTHSDLEKYKEFSTKIKKRLTNRKGYGYFRFYGYREFVNHIFDLPIDMSLTNKTEHEIYRLIENGTIKLQKDLALQFKNSLIVCDEIHNTYNSTEKNNWGIAIQSILDNEPSCRALFMSATLINNSPTESIDILNLLLPKELRQKKSDYFDQNEELKPGALEKFSKLVRGRISIMRDINPKYYPSMEFVGQIIPGISYLKFIRCPMSKFHYATYKYAIEHNTTDEPTQEPLSANAFSADAPNTDVPNTDILNTDVPNTSTPSDIETKSKKKSDRITLSQDAQYIVDFAIENPNDERIGLYKTTAIRKTLLNAPQKWKSKYGFDFVNGRIVGPALHYDTLKKYSTKYVRMLDEIKKVITEKRGKIFIYHNIVHMSGVMFIEQILLKNGMIDESGNSNDNTICMICGKKRKEHSIVGSSDESQRAMEFTKNSKNIIEASSLPYKLYELDTETLDLFKKYIVEESVATQQPLIIEVNKMCGEKLLPYLQQNGYTWLTETEKYAYVQLTAQSLEKKDAIVSAQLLQDLKDLENLKDLEPTDTTNTTDTTDTTNTTDDSDSDDNIDHTTLLNEEDSFDGKKAGGSGINDHMFRPVRYIIVHSEIDKNKLEHSIEKFNANDNSDGNKIMILIGSKIIKESYDLKAVQNVFIMGRPDNIPTLLQIRGRAIRKGSHLGLPPEKRHVRILVFVSSVPNYKNELTHEEIRYKEKIKAFDTIQKIMQVFNENAVDAPLNAETFNNYIVKSNDPFAPLPIHPIEYKYNLDDLSLTTFNIYHAKDEVKLAKRIIKRIFIEYASIWTLKDLVNAIRMAPFESSTDLSLISESSIQIALWQLCYNTDAGYVEPINKKATTLTNEKIDPLVHVARSLYDSNDKLVIFPNGQKNIIVPMYTDSKTTSQYFILCPLQEDGYTANDEPVIDIDICFRLIRSKQMTKIDMNEFVKHKRIDFDYVDKKRIFYRKYADVSIENMENIICEYGTLFHVSFLDECIQYVFNVWTDGAIEKSDMHEFYFKMLYYYDLLSLVLWAYTCKPRVFKEYTKYAIPVYAKDIKLKIISNYEKRQQENEDISPDDNSDLGTSGVINLLKTSYNRTSNIWIPREFREEFDKTLTASLELFNGRRKKIKGITKVSAKLLPIGHFISKFPRLYHPEKGWIEDPTYVLNDQTFVENDTIIGYDERSTYGTHIRFKLRKPIQSIKKYRDTRKIEKGSVCKSVPKTKLRELAKTIGVTLSSSGRTNVEELCALIRSKLIRLELKERIKKSNIKWFYFHYENSLPNK
jgi:hypothetical protein